MARTRPSDAAYQLVPEEKHRTIDVPNMTKAWSATEEPVWQWLHDAWPYAVPPDAEVMTDLDVLRGGAVTQVCRFEEGYWEMFTRSGPDVSNEEARLVPLGCLLATDPSLAPTIELAIGAGVWREDARDEWQPFED